MRALYYVCKRIDSRVVAVRGTRTAMPLWEALKEQRHLIAREGYGFELLPATRHNSAWIHGRWQATENVLPCLWEPCLRLRLIRKPKPSPANTIKYEPPPKAIDMLMQWLLGGGK